MVVVAANTVFGVLGDPVEAFHGMRPVIDHIAAEGNGIMVGLGANDRLDAGQLAWMSDRISSFIGTSAVMEIDPA